MALNHCSREQIAGPLFAAKEAALGQGRVSETGHFMANRTTTSEGGAAGGPLL